MNKKTIFFIAGMPRAGSTLLANILAQNPLLHATATSGVLNVLQGVRNAWGLVDEFKAMGEAESEKKKVQALRGLLQGYFSDVEKPIVIDKSRAWLSHLEMAAVLLNAEPKVLVPVRDIRDVLCSFEKLWRKSKDTRQIAQELGNPLAFETFQGRCGVHLDGAHLVGGAFNRIKDAAFRGFRKQMFFVEYEALTSRPAEMLSAIYDFLKVPAFSHDFNAVEQLTHEDDIVHIFKDLHKIRAKVAPQEPTWPILMPPEMAAGYESSAFFWRAL